MRIVIFGLTITSAWGNGHATTFRSLVKALHRRGHHVDFVEKDVEWYRSHRDLPHPDFCSLHLYEDWEQSESQLLTLCHGADAVVVGSYFPDAIAATQALLGRGCDAVVFYDIDTPITLAGLRANGSVEYLQAAMVPSYAAYLSFTGGPVLRELEARFVAQRAVPFYCSVDAEIYTPSPVSSDFECDLSYLGTYAADRQAKLMHLLAKPATLLPDRSFLVAGAMYPDETSWPSNVKRLQHVPPARHAAFYSSARFTLNLTRSDMVSAGYSPSVRLFEASACGAAILSDDWPGLQDFLRAGEEVLLPRDEYETVDILLHLSDADRMKMGQRARDRILSEHTSLHRAVQFEEIVNSLGRSRKNEETGPQMIQDIDRVRFAATPVADRSL